MRYTREERILWVISKMCCEEGKDFVTVDILEQRLPGFSKKTLEVAVRDLCRLHFIQKFDEGFSITSRGSDLASRLEIDNL